MSVLKGTQGRVPVPAFHQHDIQESGITRDGPFVAIEGSPIRIYAVELPETTILVVIEAGEEGFDQFVDEGQSLLDGITFC